MPTRLTRRSRMAQVQGNNLLDVLKKKMRQTKEEMEKYKEESEDMARKLQVEIRRREEVSLRHQRPTWPTLSPRAVCKNLTRVVARKSVEAVVVLPGAVARCCSGISCCCRRWTLGGMSQRLWLEAGLWQQLKSRSPPKDCHVATGVHNPPIPGQHSNPSCPKKGIRPPECPD